MKYKLLGKEEGFAICDFCGKKEISLLHHVIDTETGAAFVFGSSCIIKALKITSDEFKEMKAVKELSDLEDSVYVYALKFFDETYSGVKCKRVYATLNGTRCTRLMYVATEKEAITRKGDWTEHLTGKTVKFPENHRNALLSYFRNKKRLEATIKKIEALNP